MKDPRPYLIAAGLSESEITPAMTDPARWDVEIVRAQIANHLDPENAARRATRSGPGVERNEKMHAARVAWLAA